MKKTIFSIFLTVFLCGAVAIPNAPVPSGMETTIVRAATDLDTIGGDTSGGLDSQAIVDSDKPQEFRDTYQDILSSTEITSDDLAKAAKYAKPVVKLTRFVIAFIELIFFALISFTTAVDLLCLSFSPLRNKLGGAGNAQANAPMGYGQGYGQTPQASTQASSGMFDSIFAKIASLCSTTATQVVQECSGEQAGNTSPMGGMDMGMGMGMNGMSNQGGATPSTKNLWGTYLKKKPFELVLSAVCMVLFTSTAFTNLGILLATKLLSLFTNVSL